MAAFKDEFNPTSIALLSHELTAAWPEFPAARFRQVAGDGLEPLELLERVGHIARGLAMCLPGSFPEAAQVLHRTLASPSFTGWITLPCGQYVADCGVDDPEVALPLLAALSPRFSSEGTIRVFIEQHRDLTFECLHRWTTDPDEHVRRLVSECTRPRLPWSSQLRELIADPTPAIALLDKLHDDPSEYVRRSVANHLNDICKDHPAIAIECAERWNAASTHGDWVIRHGLRTLVKKGDPRALALLGFDAANTVTLDSLTVEPATIEIGDEVVLTAHVSAEAETRAVIDYVVHYQGAKKMRAGKVFKLANRTIAPGVTTTVTKRHRFGHVSIRRIHPGAHRLEIQVNGRVLGGSDIEVVAPDPAAANGSA